MKWDSLTLARITKMRQNKTANFIRSLGDFEEVVLRCFKDIPVIQSMDNQKKTALKAAKAVQIINSVAKVKFALNFKS